MTECLACTDECICSKCAEDALTYVCSKSKYVGRAYVYVGNLDYVHKVYERIVAPVCTCNHAIQVLNNLMAESAKIGARTTTTWPATALRAYLAWLPQDLASRLPDDERKAFIVYTTLKK